MSLIHNFGIQLYSVREETEKDFLGTLEKVAAVGYTEVEFAGYGDIPAETMKAKLDSLGMKSVGSHIIMDHLKNNFDGIIEYNKVLGSEYLIIAWHELNTIEDVQKLAEQIKEYAPRVAAAGFKFGYHNHAHEFKTDNGVCLLEELMRLTEGTGFIFELDLFWTVHAGLDPVKTIDTFGKRLELLHIKQMKDADSKKCVDLKDGMIDFKAAITAGKAYGVKHFILEQEEFEVSAWQSLESNYKHIMAM